MRKVLLPFIIAISVNAYGGITTLNITGASNTVGNVIYYSNISTTTSGGSYVHGSPCSAWINPDCREPAGTLTFQISTNSTTSAGAMVYIIAASAQPTTLTTLGTVASAAISQNSVTTINVTFAQICTAAAAASVTGFVAGCNMDTASVPLYIIVDNGATGTYASTDDIATRTFTVQSSIPVNDTAGSSGVYTWSISAGESRVKLNITGSDTTYPTAENIIGAQALQLFYKDMGQTVMGATLPFVFGATPYDPSVVPSMVLPIDTTTGLPLDPWVKPPAGYPALNNETTYCFKLGVVDNAGNIGFVTQDGYDAASHCAIPGQIAGLLTNQNKCFIATAAFGTPMAKEVQVLRDFRDRYLMRTSLGRNFVSWYYDHSPKWAAKLAQDGNARALVRGGLYPVIAYSWLALKLGAFSATLIFGILVLLPFLFLRYRQTIWMIRDRDED